MSYPPLNLPVAPLRLSSANGVTKVWDPLRKKHVAFTPEENVRQHFIHWLMTDFGYPASLMANEIGIEVNGTRRRCDTVVFEPGGKPLVIIEYKAPDVTVTQDTFDQIVRYNMTLHARYLVVSNGLTHYCCVMDYVNDTYHFIPRIPDYQEVRLGTRDN